MSKGLPDNRRTRQELNLDVDKEGNAFQKKKKRSIFTAFGVLGAFALAAFAVSPTAASWMDSEAAGSEISAGSFDLEISTDGGSTWQSDGGTATLALDDFDYWAPGDEDSTNFSLRVSPGSSHSGEIGFSCDTVGRDFNGNLPGYNWNIQGAAGSDVFPELQGISGHTLENTSENCSNQEFGGESEFFTLAPGEQTTFTVRIIANPALAQNSNTSMEWEFTAESIPNS